MTLSFPRKTKIEMLNRDNIPTLLSPCRIEMEMVNGDLFGRRHVVASNPHCPNGYSHQMLF
jgi:hypothetical protein